LIIVGIVGATATAATQATWLPAPVRQGLVEQLNERMVAIGPGTPKDPAGLAQAMGKVVTAVAQRVDTWAERGVVDRAPTFPRLTVPAAGNRHLDAMNRYQICNMVLFPQFESGSDLQARRTAAFGLTAVTIAVVRLREPYVAAGGNDQLIEAFLTGPPMAKVLDAVLATPDLLAHVESRCEPVIGDLLATAF